MDPSEIGRAMNALRKHHGGGGSKRRVPHSTQGYCLCIDCRKARGHYPLFKVGRHRYGTYEQAQARAAPGQQILHLGADDVWRPARKPKKKTESA
jgi:hypothetical protein